MKEVSVSQLRADCSSLLKQVQKTRSAIRVTRFGKTIAEIAPVAPVAPGDWMGSMKDSIEILGYIVAPASNQEDWVALRD
jgi:antitoxin (DNA-binding transcriptional repressor) of toxin-antitoxin stability system